MREQSFESLPGRASAGGLLRSVKETLTAGKVLKLLISVGAVGSIIVLALAFWLACIVGFVYILIHNLK
jgi:hypothetical protein